MPGLVARVKNDRKKLIGKLCVGVGEVFILSQWGKRDELRKMYGSMRCS